MSSTGERRRRVPSLRVALEARAGPELAATALLWPWLRLAAAAGDGHAVLVLPGWLAGDTSTLVLRRVLRSVGYHAHGWRQGINLGPRPALVRALERRLLDLSQRHRAPLTLIGWSLGGLYARALSELHPASVRQVIALASPLQAADGRALGDAFERALGRRAVANARVPFTALYSRSDAIVPWQACVVDEGPARQNVEVPSSHIGMGHHPAALWLIAQRLALPVEPWQPLDTTPLFARLLGVRKAAPA